MTPWTADLRHLALVGLPASAIVADARQVSSVTAPGTFEIPGHGFDGRGSLSGVPERVRFSGNNVNGVSLDSAINPVAYYDVNASVAPDFFTVSLSGVPLVLVGDGVGLPFVLEDIRPKINAIMQQWTSKVIGASTAYAGPWDAAYVPGWAPLLIAQLAAPTVANILRIASARFDVATIQANQVEAAKMYGMLLAGVPFNDGGPVFDATTTADNSAFAANDRAPTCWRTGSP